MGPLSLGWLVKELARRVRRRLWDYVPDGVVLARRYQRTVGHRLNLRRAPPSSMGGPPGAHAVLGGMATYTHVTPRQERERLAAYLK